MRKKFPIILIVIFSIFAFTKIAFFYLYVDSVRENSQKFNKVIGDLRYCLKPYEESAVKFKFARMLQSMERAETKSVTDSKDVDISTLKDKDVHRKAQALNKSLNQFTKKYLLDNSNTDSGVDIGKEAAMEDSYTNQKIVTEFKWDKDKSRVQKEQMGALQEILPKKEYLRLQKIIDTMNKKEAYLDIKTHQKILAILEKEPDLDAYLILNQLCGKFEILAYYEVEDTAIVKKDLKGIKTKELSPSEDKQYRNLVNKELLLLDVIYAKYFNGFFIFSDTQKGQVAYAADFQNNERGYLGLDATEFSGGLNNDFEKERFYRCILSELSKVILLSNNQIDYSNANTISDMDDFDIIKKYSKKDSYILQFYVRFWDDLLYQDSSIASRSEDENARKYFYLRHNREFLSEYVSQNPFKDIIESMNVFILEDKPLEPGEKYQKIRFFYEFSELNDIKQRIALNIKHMEEI